MANYYEKISVLIDVTTDKAVNGFNNFKTAIKDAEGFSGKFKAGIGSLKESLGGLVSGPVGPAAVAGAATAIGTAWIKAGQTFIDTARQARDLSVATGLGIEDASRLIEVFGDLGGDAGSLASSIGKITKSLDDDKWNKYGIATRDASGEARDANDIFLESLDVLRDIKNPTERAAAGTELYGKSWANLAPLISQSDDALRDALKSVKDGKVITEEEADKADKLAEGFDNIKDAVEEMVLAAGQVLVEMKPIFDVVALTLEAIAYDIGLIMDAWDWLVGPSDKMEEFNAKLKAYNEYIAKMKEITEDVPPVMTEFGDANKYAAEQAYYAQLEAQDLADTLANRADSLARAAYNAQNRIKDLYDEIDQDKTWVDFQLRILGVKEQLDQLAQDFEDEKISSEEYGLQIQKIFLEGEQGILDFVATLDREVPAEVITALLADFKAGDIKAVVDRLQTIVDQNPITAKLTTVGGQTAIPSSVRDGSIVNGGTYITVNMGVVGDRLETGRTIVKLIQDYNNATGGWGGAGRI